MLGADVAVAQAADLRWRTPADIAGPAHASALTNQSTCSPKRAQHSTVSGAGGGEVGDVTRKCVNPHMNRPAVSHRPVRIARSAVSFVRDLGRSDARGKSGARLPRSRPRAGAFPAVASALDRPSARNAGRRATPRTAWVAVGRATCSCPTSSSPSVPSTWERASSIGGGTKSDRPTLARA